jgi:hypothetical protein
MRGVNGRLDSIAERPSCELVIQVERLVEGVETPVLVDYNRREAVQNVGREAFSPTMVLRKQTEFLKSRIHTSRQLNFLHSLQLPRPLGRDQKYPKAFKGFSPISLKKTAELELVSDVTQTVSHPFRVLSHWR